MVIFSFFLFIERIIFMFSNKLEVKENVSQTFYYYFSGVGGLIYFFVLFCISIIGLNIFHDNLGYLFSINFHCFDIKGLRHPR